MTRRRFGVFGRSDDVVERMRRDYNGGRFDKVFDRRAAAAHAAPASMPPQDWFWFNAYGALAAIHTSRRDLPLTAQSVTYAAAACDTNYEHMAETMAQLNTLFYGHARSSAAAAVAATLEQHRRPGDKAPRSRHPGEDGITDDGIAFIDYMMTKARVIQLIAASHSAPDSTPLDEGMALCDEQLAAIGSIRVRARLLDMRAHLLLQRARFNGFDDLIEATNDGAEALHLVDELTGEDDLRSDLIKTRTDVLREVTEQTGDTDYLDEAIRLAEEDLERHPGDIDMMFNLSNCLLTRFECEITLGDLRRANKLSRDAIALTRDTFLDEPTPTSTRALRLAVPLSSSLALYEMESDPAALVDAVDSGTFALALLPAEDHRVSDLERTLSMTMSRLYRVTRDPKPQQRAIDLAHAALAHSDGDPDELPALLLRIADALFDRVDDPYADPAARSALIGEAVANIDRASALAGPGHRTRGHLMWMITRAATIEQPPAAQRERIDTALALVRGHGEALAASDYGRTRMAGLAAQLLAQRHRLTGQIGDLDAAIGSARQAASFSPETTEWLLDRRTLIQLLRRRILLAGNQGERDELMASMLDCIGEVLGELSWRSDVMPYHATLTWLHSFPDLGATAAAAYAANGQFDAAINAIERTRCHLWQSQTTASPAAAALVTDLRAAEYRALRLIESVSGAREGEASGEMIDLHQRISDLKRRLASLRAQHDRHQPGGDWLRHDEALVYLVPPAGLASTPWAAIMRDGHVATCTLPDDGSLTSILNDMLSAGHGQTTAFVSIPAPNHLVNLVEHVGVWMGRTILAPLLEQVGGTLRNLTIVPVGPLALLPLHAATIDGHPVTDRLDLRTRLSGTAPTPAGTDRGATVVAVASDPDLQGAAFVDAARHFGAGVAVVQGAELQSLVARVDGAQRVVVVCHGEAGRSRTDTVLNLGAHRIVFDDFDQLEHRDRALFWIAACCCRTPLPHLPDELVGFPQSLLRAGFKSVVSGCWNVDTGVAVMIGYKFAQLTRADPDLSDEDALTQAQRWLRTATGADLAAVIDQVSGEGDGIGTHPASDPLRSQWLALASATPYSSSRHWAAYAVLTG